MMKYNLQSLAIGMSMIIPVDLTIGRMHSKQRVQAAIGQYAKRCGVKFKMQSFKDEFKITRVE